MLIKDLKFKFLINQYLNTNNIVVVGDKFINPIFNFNETNFPGISLV